MTGATDLAVARQRDVSLSKRSSLYLITAVGLALVILLAFNRTYWAPIAAGSIALHPAIHVHAALFFAWTLLFVLQTFLVAGRQVAWHRKIGMFGIALALAMVLSGILAAIISLEAGLAGPRPEAARRAAALSFSGMTLFATFIALGVANVRVAERHKRFMMLATFSILQAAIARVIMLFPSVAQPERVQIGAAIVDGLVLLVMFYDRRLTGRWSPVYLSGLAFIVAIQILRTVILETPQWIAFAAWLSTLRS